MASRRLEWLKAVAEEMEREKRMWEARRALHARWLAEMHAEEEEKEKIEKEERRKGGK